MRHARKCIEDGMKVKVDMRCRGRLITRQDVGTKIMYSFTEEIADIAVVEKKDTKQKEEKIANVILNISL